MIFKTTEIDFFKNLLFLESNNEYHDLHGDYNCIRLNFETKVLELLFKNIHNEKLLSFKFLEVTLSTVELSNSQNFAFLEIDNIYRGRRHENNQLIELNGQNQSYFYIDFLSGMKMEFWSSLIVIESP